MAISAAALVPGVLFGESRPGRVSYLSTRADANGGYFVCGFDADGGIRLDLPLPGRGHAVAVHPNRREAVVIARRPGRFLIAVNLAYGEVIFRVDAEAGRHFYGHGVYSPDGGLLYTTENDYQQGRGIIGIRDVASGYRQIGELSSHGVGPHELLLGSDGRALIVANGGILTHPDSGRTKLNLDEMSPSLACLDVRTGSLLDERRLPAELHQLSIRHLAVLADGCLCLAMQYQGPRTDDPPLVGLCRPGEEIRLLRAPSEIQRCMRNYCGSVSTDLTGNWFAVTSPRGNLVTLWDAAGAYAGSARLQDACGVAPGDMPGAFTLSGGAGERLRLRIGTDHGQPLEAAGPKGARWDNHLVKV